MDLPIGLSTRIDYKDQRVKFLSWLLNFGKSPDKGKGYSESTIYSDAYRTAKFDKWVWIEGDRYRYPQTKERDLAATKYTAAPA
jgi:hypothetical protein